MKEMYLFYTPQISGDLYVLPAGEARHCVRILRLSVGDVLTLTDGKGGFYEGEITESSERECLVRVLKKQEEYGKRGFRVHIAVAPTRHTDRMDWLLEKCVEIGIDEVTLFTTEHSVRRTLKLERLEKVMIAAMKQSLKAYLPTLNPIVDFRTFIDSCGDGQKFIAHCHSGEKKRLHEVYIKGEDALILIGPEGDFSETEIELAVKAGFVPISLGDSRLRTETAGVVACHSVNLLNEL
ncbi:ribosomal RNA small subunit methyltransferase E [Bacteroidia bacterium]|nr:ribosomal RNA small subunit methyltransferase E [Bacteroidia bacterium]